VKLTVMGSSLFIS